MTKKLLNLRKEIVITICLVGCATIFAQETGVEINGMTWATRNVGVFENFVENPEAPGMFYQWNSKIGWNSTDPLISFPEGYTWNPNWDGDGAKTWEVTNNPCPCGWRIPTEAELKTLIYSNSVWTKRNGINGRLFGTAPNTIFLPAVGFRDNDATLYESGSFGAYWSSAGDSNVQETTEGVFSMGFDDNEDEGGVSENVPARGMGLSVRCIFEGSSGINDVSMDIGIATVIGYFDILGRKQQEEPTTGIYVILYDNGKTKKMMK